MKRNCKNCDLCRICRDKDFERLECTQNSSFVASMYDRYCRVLDELTGKLLNEPANERLKMEIDITEDIIEDLARNLALGDVQSFINGDDLAF